MASVLCALSGPPRRGNWPPKSQGSGSIRSVHHLSLICIYYSLAKDVGCQRQSLLQPYVSSARVRSAFSNPRMPVVKRQTQGDGESVKRLALFLWPSLRDGSMYHEESGTARSDTRMAKTSIETTLYEWGKTSVR